MKLSHLRDVIAVAEQGSLRAAARHIDVAQPAITRSIREVEQELGATLFERHARGVRLTEIGVAFVRRASAIHSELRRAHEEVEQLKGRDVGEVSVSLSTASSLSLMPSAVKAFRKRYPDALLKISDSFFRPIENDILAGAIDFYVGPIDDAPVSQRFHVEELFATGRLILARKGHPLASSRKLSDLIEAQWVRPVLSGNNVDVDVDILFEKKGYPPPQVALHARSWVVMLLVVMNTDLLTIMPEQWLDFPLLSNLVAPLPLDEPLNGVPICIVRRRDMPLTPLAEAFCDLLRKAALNYVHRRDAEHASKRGQPR